MPLAKASGSFIQTRFKKLAGTVSAGVENRRLMAPDMTTDASPEKCGCLDAPCAAHQRLCKLGARAAHVDITKLELPNRGP